MLTDIPCLLRQKRGHSQISGIGVYKLEDRTFTSSVISLISYKILLLLCLYFSYLVLLCVAHFHLNAAAVCNAWVVLLCHV